MPSMSSVLSVALVTGRRASDQPAEFSTAYQIFWDFGDGSHATDSIASHAFTVSGTKSVTCTITDSGAKESASSITVLVNPVPAVTVSANHAAAGPGALLTFSAHVTGGTGSFHYVWDFGDQTAGTGARWPMERSEIAELPALADWKNWLVASSRLGSIRD